MKNRVIMQGEVYKCDMGDVIGSEQSGVRPSLVVSVDVLNRTSTNILVFPITSKLKKIQPFHKLLTQEKYPFLKYKVNTVLCENMKSISKDRINQYLGRIEDDDLEDILEIKEFVFKEI